jgi:hypothetical protein
MNDLVRHYFRDGRFHCVVAVHEDENASWEKLSPLLPRGWFELSRLTAEDRVEFTRGFWNATLPYLSRTEKPFGRFFDDLSDVCVMLIQEKEKGPFSALLIYELADKTGFFWGEPPAGVVEVLQGRTAVAPHQLPADYSTFFKIHNGFGKADDTGLLPIEEIGPRREALRAQLGERTPLTLNNEVVNRDYLIPFYQSYGQDAYQCFYADWYPEQEMGNLYYSGIEQTLSNPKSPGSAAEKMAFPTFLDWLAFYLECIR